jgi:hypothetical protein
VASSIGSGEHVRERIGIFGLRPEMESVVIEESDRAFRETLSAGPAHAGPIVRAWLESLEKRSFVHRYIEEEGLFATVSAFSELATRIGGEPWTRMSPARRRDVATRALAELPTASRGSYARAIAEVLMEAPKGGLWTEIDLTPAVRTPPPHASDDEGFEEASVEESARLLDEMIEEQRERDFREGPDRLLETRYVLMELPPSAATKGRKVLASGGDDAMERSFAALIGEEVARRESHRLGDHDTFEALLTLLGESTVLNIYTPAKTRALLERIEALPREDLRKLAKEPVRELKAALRKAIAHENAFAIALDTMLL